MSGVKELRPVALRGRDVRVLQPKDFDQARGREEQDGGRVRVRSYD